MFQIIQVSPVYHWSTDAIIGSKYRPLEMSYSNLKLAHKIAGRMEDKNYRECGDDYFIVVPYGESQSKRIYPTYTMIDDMPF